MSGDALWWFLAIAFGGVTFLGLRFGTIGVHGAAADRASNPSAYWVMMVICAGLTILGALGVAGLLS